MAEPFWDFNVEAYDGEDYDPNPWGQCVLASERLPGYCEVEASPSKRVQEKSGAGTNGATPTFVGYEPAPIAIRWYIWRPWHWEEAQRLIALFWPKLVPAASTRKTLANAALDIYHPSLAPFRITRAVLHKFDTPRPGRVIGEKLITITATEFRPPDRKSGSAVKTAASAENTVIDPENVPARAPGAFVTYTPLDGGRSVTLPPPASSPQVSPVNDPNYSAP